MRTISSYKRQFKNDMEKRSRDLKRKTEIELQIAELEKERDSLDKTIVADEEKAIMSGLRYYNSDKRLDLISSAKKLHYNNLQVKNIEIYDDNSWNTDNVTMETILSLESMEQYVGENLPWWEKSTVSKIGKFLNFASEGYNDDN